jgi:hypothetical protein
VSWFYQQLLVLEPLLPRSLRHVVEGALAKLAGMGREIEPVGRSALGYRSPNNFDAQLAQQAA